MTLPPLPDPDYWSTRDDDTPLFTAAQMESYARAAIAAHVPEAAFGNIAAVPGATREGCNYLSAPGRICNKCGHDHAAVPAQPVAWMDDFGNVFPLAANKGAGSWMDDHKRNWKPLYAAPQAVPVPAVPVASVTECEACFTPDACQLRGKCDHYAAEQLRVAKRPDPLVQWGDWTLVPLNATEPMQKAMQVAVLLRKSMNEVWRAAMSEAPEKKP